MRNPVLFIIGCRCTAGTWCEAVSFDGGTNDLQFPQDVALCHNNEIAVSDGNSAEVKVYDQSGKIKTKFSTRDDRNQPPNESRPWQIVLNTDGL